jgi:ribosomal protein L29
MKRQDLDKYHNLSITELQDEVRSLEKTLQVAKLELSLNKLKNVHTVKNLRHDISRLKTLITAKGAQGSASSPEANPKVKSAK